MGFYIKDLGIGFGAFKKMDTFGLPPEQNQGRIELKDNMLVNVGEAYIVINLSPDAPGVVQENLNLKIFGGTNNGQEYKFNMNQYAGQGQAIVIGRTPDCDIKITDKLLSKIQSHIRVEQDYNGYYRWILFDGSVEGKPSTNGTWIYINEDVPIYEGLIFKANQTIFQAHLEQAM